MFSDAAARDPGMLSQYDYERIENEFYPTPPKFLNCLAEHFPLFGTNWWEPCAGQGHLALALEELSGAPVTASDLVRYEDHSARPGFRDRVLVADFLDLTKAPFAAMGKSNDTGLNGICTNPPYLTVKIDDPEWVHLKPLAERYGSVNPKTKKVSLAELFLRHALALMEPVEGKVAFFLRNEFDCADGRMDLFQHPAFVAKIICSERPRWIEGSTGSPRHNYAWYYFDWSNSNSDPYILFSHPKRAKPITTN